MGWLSLKPLEVRSLHRLVVVRHYSLLYTCIFKYNLNVLLLFFVFSYSSWFTLCNADLEKYTNFICTGSCTKRAGKLFFVKSKNNNISLTPCNNGFYQLHHLPFVRWYFVLKHIIFLVIGHFVILSPFIIRAFSQIVLSTISSFVILSSSIWSFNNSAIDLSSWSSSPFACAFRSSSILF